jgi:hypothetical protein
MSSVYLACPMRVSDTSRIEALTEHDSELVAGGKPLPDIPAALLKVADGQLDQLGGSIFGRE